MVLCLGAFVSDSTGVYKGEPCAGGGGGGRGGERAEQPL